MTNPTSFHTLSEFLLQAGTEYFIIDISRTRRLLNNQDFFECELNNKAFDSPRQGHAWCCIVFWNKQLNTEHYMWFIKMPLDEQGLFVQAARDQFLQIVIEALGRDLSEVDSKQAQLPENPFIFTPSQQQLADCNATIRHKLGLDKREGYHAALRYLKAPNVQPWSELSVQDMSDLALEINDSDVSKALIQNLEILPQPVCLCLFSTFEGINLNPDVRQSLLAYHKRCEPSLSPMVLRALASSRCDDLDTYIRDLIAKTCQNENTSLDTETLVVIAGRHWQCLSPENGAPPDCLSNYFTALATADPSLALCKGIFADMVQLPALRVFLLAMIRASQPEPILQSAIASLLEKGA